MNRTDSGYPLPPTSREAVGLKLGAMQKEHKSAEKLAAANEDSKAPISKTKGELTTICRSMLICM